MGETAFLIITKSTYQHLYSYIMLKMFYLVCLDCSRLQEGNDPVFMLNKHTSTESITNTDSVIRNEHISNKVKLVI